MPIDANRSVAGSREFLQSPLLQRLLRWLILLLSCLFLVLFLYTALRRMRYPFDLEWVESGMLNSVRRVIQGQKLYVAPSIDFVPFLYAPLYFYLAAGLAKLVGTGYMALRLISILSTIGSGALIYAFIVTETSRRLGGIAGAGLFLACYPLVETFYDIGRVDSLFVFLMLLALFCLRRGHPALSALAWVLCFQTKQSILPVAIVVLCMEWRHPRRVLLGLGSFAVVLGASMAWMNYSTQGWYNFYLFHLAGSFGIVWRQALLFYPNDVLGPVGIALLLGLAAWAFTDVDLRRPAASFYALTTIVLYGAIGYVAAHRGASANAYMPVYAWTAVLFGVSLNRLLDRLQRVDDPRAALAVTVVLAATATQLAMCVYNPGRYIPPPAVQQARQRFIDQIRGLPGDVYVVEHNYDAVLAGKLPHAEDQALGAVLIEPSTVAERVRAELDNSISSHRYSAIIIDGPLSSDAYHFQDAYPYALSAESEDGRYLTSQPTWILLPCSTAAGIAPLVMREDTTIRPEKCPTARP